MSYLYTPQLFTARVDKSSNSIGTNYQNTSGKPMLVVGHLTVSSTNPPTTSGLEVTSDATATPTAIVYRTLQYLGSGTYSHAFCFLVLAGHYYKIASGGGAATTYAVGSWWEIT